MAEPSSGLTSRTVGEGLGAHALAADLGEPGVLDVIKRVADGAEVEGDPIARLGAGGGRHADGLGAVGRASGMGAPPRP